MLGLTMLIAAAWLAHHGARWSWATAAALLAAVWAGTTLPDLDLSLGLGHRSGLTHSVLLPALACAQRRWRPIAAGLALGIGLHLSADLFPHAMRGFATVKLPGLGALGPVASYWWIGGNAAGGIAAGAGLTATSLPRREAAAALAAAALIGIAYLFRTQGGWAALALLAVVGWLASRASRRVAAQ